MKRLLSLFLTISVSITLIPTVYAADTGITQNPNVVSVGDSHTAVIKNDGTLWMWGNNEYGQLGNGTTESSFVPIKILDNVSSVSCGDDYTAAIKNDGTLWMWGNNEYGQLGNGTTESSFAPIKILDNINAVSCSEVNARTAAIKNDGTLWMWGNNGNGELGNDSTTSSYVPIKVLDNVSAVSCDWLHTAAVKRDGTLWMWGSNADGQLGIGSTWRSTIPVKVLDNVKSVSCGSYHTAAIKTDGTLWSWGAGWLGNGTSEGSSIPTKILDGVSSVSCGNQHSAIIKTDGSLWTWGANWWGELGDGTTEDSKVPIKILENVSLVSCRGHLAAVKKDGSLWTWGMNSHGQLGNGGDGNGISAGGCAIQTFPIKVMNNVKIVNTNLILLSKPSSWAESEVNSAKNAGLVTDSVTEDYQANITREQFCEMVVKLYEKITGKKAKTGYISFDDTYNDEILKAANLGIVNGYSEDTFAPHDYITREQIAAMLVRAIGIAYANVDLRDYIYRTFSDSYNISDWAMDSVQFAVDNYIMQGVGDNKIDPLGNTTCEQAILLVNRVYQNRKNFENKNIVEIIEELKKIEFGEDEAVNSVTVKYSDGSDASGVRIKEIKKSDLIYQTTGMKGAGVNITSSDNFDKATITFEYNAEQLNGSNPSDLAIAWYNTDLDRIEVLESQVDTYNHTVSVETTHFSQYILVDSKEWYSIWQRGQTIIRETDKSGNYADNFNVQLVVDCSGSMSGDRIVTARECTYDFIQKLSANDKFSLIQFEDYATTAIPSTLVKDADMESVKNIVMSMRDGGGTEFNAALNECIRTLDFDDDYNNIIVFLSDGVSSVDDSLLETLRKNNVRIASVALGSGSDTNMMKKLSDSTNGQYVYAENSSDLDAIYSAIQGSLIGVDATDTDGDGIPDMIEITGMKNQYGKIIRTDPNKYDTDSDGKSDGEEMGKLIESNKLTDMDKKNGITSNVYFEMKSNPLDGIDEADISECVILNESLTLGQVDLNGEFNCNFKFKCVGTAENLCIHFETDDCIDWGDFSAHPIDYAYTDYNGDIFKPMLSPGNYNTDLPMECHNIYQGLQCNNSHKVKMIISGDNFETVEIEAVANTSNSNSSYPIVKPTKKVTYDDYIACKLKLVTLSKKIPDEIFTKNKSYDKTLMDVKQYIKAYVYDKETEVPSEIYEAFAKAILETITDDGININELDTNMSKMTTQIYKQLKSGVKSIDKSVEIDGQYYPVKGLIAAVSWAGELVGVSWANVMYNGKTIDLVWNSNGMDAKEFAEKSNNAIAAFGTVVAQLNSELWKDFMSYYVVDTAELIGIRITKDNADKVLDKTEKVIRAICGDKDDAKNLIDSMGETAKEKLKNGIFKNGFREFIEDNFENSDTIIRWSEEYLKVKEEFTKFEEKFKFSSSPDETLRDYENIQKLLQELEAQIN